MSRLEPQRQPFPLLGPTPLHEAEFPLVRRPRLQSPGMRLVSARMVGTMAMSRVETPRAASP